MHVEENVLGPMLNIPFLITLLKTFRSVQKETLTFNEPAVTLTWSIVKFVRFHLHKQTFHIEVVNPFEAEDYATRTSLL